MIDAGVKLKDAGINFLAVDFDMTLVDTHTEGRWSRSASELASRVRPCMRQLLQDALYADIYVAVVTLSPQVGGRAHLASFSSNLRYH